MASQVSHWIYFVRHGQSLSNATGKTFTPEEDVITDYGREQAALLGEALSEVKFTRAIASNYQRAIETGKTVLAKQKISTETEPISLQIDPRLRERQVGNLEGLPANEVWNHICKQLESGKKIFDVEYPGAATAAEFLDRQRTFLKDELEVLKNETESSTLLVVSHGVTLKVFCDALVHNVLSDVVTYSGEKMEEFPWAEKNTCWSRLAINFEGEHDKKKAVVRWEEINRCDHVDKMPAEKMDGIDKSG